MKKSMGLKILFTAIAVYFSCSASAQYFKPPIDGSWLHKCNEAASVHFEK